MFSRRFAGSLRWGGYNRYEVYAIARYSRSSSCKTGMKAYDSLSSTYKIISHSDTNNDKSLGAAWYVCGPTVYDSAHLGHGRTYILLDILRRVMLHLHSGNTEIPYPLYVMNVTDIDDKIIKRSQEIATEQNEMNQSNAVVKDADPIALARHYEREFWQDMDQLNILRPDVICRVSEHIESTIVPYIQQIIDGGMAYVISEDDNHIYGSVYFDVRAFEEKSNGRTKYGKLAPDSASSDFFTWNDTNNDEDEAEYISRCRKKRDPRDFCLWKYRSQQSNSSTIEPSSVSYQSPWGLGRPGWHVECSAMIERLSQDFASTHRFLVHAGGVDLKFPHHSNEIAQAEAFGLTSNTTHNSSWNEWIPHWVHTGHLYVKGRKMSKSLKNFVTIREMLNLSSAHDSSQTVIQNDNEWSSPADDFRLWCLGLSGSYRGPATYSQDRMEEARVIREKWIRFLIEGQRLLDDLSDKQNGQNDSILPRMWQKRDNELFYMVTKSSVNCRNALVGIPSTGGTMGSTEMDGSTFVKEMTNMTDEGMRYLEQAKNLCPAEPLQLTLSSIRGLLKLVGFTSKTFNAGIRNIQSKKLELATTTSSGSLDLIDEIVRFRAAVRSSAIDGIRNKAGIASAKEILRLCDELRDDVMPSLGVEILDGKSGNTGTESGGWRNRPPRLQSSNTT